MKKWVRYWSRIADLGPARVFQLRFRFCSCFINITVRYRTFEKLFGLICLFPFFPLTIWRKPVLGFLILLSFLWLLILRKDPFLDLDPVLHQIWMPDWHETPFNFFPSTGQGAGSRVERFDATVRDGGGPELEFCSCLLHTQWPGKIICIQGTIICIPLSWPSLDKALCKHSWFCTCHSPMFFHKKA